MNLPTTHCVILISLRAQKMSVVRTYTVSLQVSAPETVMVFVEVHHLESVELIRDFFDLLLLVRLLDFDTFCIPV